MSFHGLTGESRSLGEAMKNYYVYILASQRNGTLYIGITSDLISRMSQHKNKAVDGFSKKYKIDILVYYEIFEDASEAILREKRLKKWNRVWKLRLIEKENSKWEDLSDKL